METTKLVAALIAASLKFAPVVKETKGQIGQNRDYKYADLSALLDATMPALLANGVLVLQAVDAETATLITRLAHTSGEWCECAYPLKLDLLPQQFGSSLTYGRRYSLQSLLCLAAEDDDGKASSAKPAAVKVAGLDEWLIDLEAVADSGSAALQATWKASKPALKKHLIETAPETWERIKRRAAGFDKAQRTDPPVPVNASEAPF